LINIDVFVNDDLLDSFPFEDETIEYYSAEILKKSGIFNAEINIIFIGDSDIKELNENYKKHSGPTDVLSFNLSEENSNLTEGEIYISLERAKEQAAELGVRYEEEIIRLITHGLLHLSGRTHDNAEDFESITTDTNKYVKDFFNNQEK
jgi:probable rRNA maturation factor